MPHLCSMSPGGAHHIEDLWRAGGVQALMAQLLAAGLIDGETITVTGATTAENVAGAKVTDAEVIRPLEDPHHKVGGLAFMKGTSRRSALSSNRRP
ncbi:MAG: dihydroxy-acid dehydratase [Cloacibacillus evryensis]